MATSRNKHGDSTNTEKKILLKESENLMTFTLN